MKEKFDQILHNQTLMLREMTTMRKDLNKVTNDVAELKKGQQELKKGQEELIGRVTTLEEGQQELIGRVTILEEGQQELKKGQEYLKKKVDFAVDEQTQTNEELKWLHEDYLKTKSKVAKLEKNAEKDEIQIA